MMTIQFNDLKFKQRDNKSLIVEMVAETQEIFTMSPEHFSPSLLPWTHSQFNDSANLLIRKLHIQPNVYIQFQEIHK